MSHRTVFVLVLSLTASVWPVDAEAQVLGTFRWRTEPFCNVLNVTVAQNGAAFTLDGFDEQCGGNPRLPVHGIAVAQPNGTITIGVNVVSNTGILQPVNLEAVISPATISGTWRDSAGGSGVFTFNPAGTSGGPRPGAIPPAALPTTFSFSPNGAFAAIAGAEADAIPASGTGSRMMWHAAKSAFRAGRAEGTHWDEPNVGFYSAAFGIRTIASGNASFATGVDTAATEIGAFAAGTQALAGGAFALALGSSVEANGANTVALGSFARANAVGSFVYGDASTSSVLLAPAPHTFTVRASGGARFFSNSAMTLGVVLPFNGGAWASVSDVNMKENFRDLDPDDVLSKMARMPVREWNYKAQGAAIRHAGPTAQDFHAAFGLGEDPLRISTIDADGIALAGVQALEARTRHMRTAHDTLARENADLKSELAALLERLERLEQWLAEKR